MILPLSLVFFLSGAAALVFETLWFRQAGLALGNGVWASSLVLASFMAGLALGNGLAARYGERVRRPLRAYAGLEVIVAATGAGLVCAWPLLGTHLAPIFRRLVDAPLALNAARIGVAFALLMIPAAAMGATLPLLTRALALQSRAFGRTLGWLYGANTLGAVAGAVATETLLVGPFGVRGTAFVAAGMNLSAATAAYFLSQDVGLTGVAPSRMPSPPQDRARRLLAAAFVCGATMLALEVVWLRFLSMFVTNTSLAFALVLAVVLLGIGMGGLLAAVWLKLGPGAGAYLRPLLLVATVLTLATYVGFEYLPGIRDQSTQVLRIVGLALYLTFPVSLLSGLSFTLLGQRAHPEGGSEARTTGRLTLANTLGAILGSLAAGFGLLPGLGMERSVAILALAFALAALLVPRAARSAPARACGVAALVLVVASLLLFPFGLMQRRYFAAVEHRFGSDGSRIVSVREGLTETLIYMRRDDPFRPPVFRLVTNGFSMSATNILSQRYMSLYAWWPAAVHPRLRQTLLISYGCGTTARALTQVPGVERIDVVDISRDILDASRIAHPPGENPLEDPRVHAHVEDGRHYLLTSDRRYDLITGEPPPPRSAGVVNLYTREYFDLMRTRLAPNGIVTYWLPVDQLMVADAKATVRAFCDAFPDCSLWNGSALNWMLAGTNGLAGAVSEDEFARPWNDPRLGRSLRRIGVELPEQLGALFIDDSEGLRSWIGDAPPLTDDFPHRILTPVGSTDVVRDVIPAYQLRMEAGQARRRFEASRFITEVWPRSWRERSLPQFEWQGRLNDALFASASWQPPSTRGLEDVDVILTRAPLQTVALWLLGTDVDEQETVSALAQRGERHEEPLGLGALAARQYEAAALMFARAGGDANLCRRAYALALAGRNAEVETLATAHRSAPGGDSLAAFWTWMNRRFGVPRVPELEWP